MPTKTSTDLTRREWIRAAILAGGSLLMGVEKLASAVSRLDFLADTKSADPFREGTQLGTLPFSDEGFMPAEMQIGTELNGRLYTDLSELRAGQMLTPTSKFYVRTSASKLLNSQKVRSIKLSASGHSADISAHEFIRNSEPQGRHLMECAGNGPAGQFGLLSVADWAGVPLVKLANRFPLTGARNQLLISGFDEYVARSGTSIAGASWIFSWEDIQNSRAFLATKMNGQPLTLDHGAPVRLVVPGWYGCTCIKWVREITVVDSEVEPTSQMQEYAERTHQEGTPRVVSEYRPAKIDSAALPIRIEKWLVKGQLKYRVVGILWGGERLVKNLQIQFNPGDHYMSVESLKQEELSSWTLWSHTWTPRRPGRYRIRLRVNDPGVQTRRLDMGFYLRTVDVPEV